MFTTSTLILVILVVIACIVVTPFLLMLPDAKGWREWFTRSESRFVSSRFLLRIPLKFIEYFGAFCLLLSFGCFTQVDDVWTSVGVISLGTMGWVILVEKRRSPTLFYDGFAIMFKRTTAHCVEVHVSTRYKHAVKPESKLPIWQCMAVRYDKLPDLALLPTSMRDNKISPCMAIVLCPDVHEKLFTADVHDLVVSSPILTSEAAQEVLSLWNSRAKIQGSRTIQHNLRATEFLLLKLAGVLSRIPRLNNTLAMRHANRINSYLLERKKAGEPQCNGVVFKLK